MFGFDDDSYFCFSCLLMSLFYGLFWGCCWFVLVQYCEFWNIWGDDGCVVIKFVYGSFCVGGKKVVFVSGDYYWIDDDYWWLMFVEEGCNCVDDFSGVEYFGFDGVDFYVIIDSGQLLDQEVGWWGVDGVYFFGVLGY